VSEYPTVSIIVPAWNAERTLGAAINSVLAQTFLDFEIVVCDDSSTDGTRAVVESFDDPRVRLIRTTVNSGEGIARDQAIDAALGKWIAVLDADDMFEPARLSTLLTAAADDSDVMVFDDLMTCHDAGAGVIPWRRLRGRHAFGLTFPQPGDVPFTEFIVSNRLLIKPLMPTDWIRRHRIRHSSRKFGADTEFFLRLAATGLRFRYVPEALYLYRATATSMTATAGKPGALYDCIASCMQLDGFDKPARDAFQRKLRKLHDNDVLHGAWLEAISGHPLRATLNMLCNPRSLAMLPARVSRRAHYQMHRYWRGGGGR
jgi:glycosyltransferase involved in cell wall biosynthesis